MIQALFKLPEFGLRLIVRRRLQPAWRKSPAQITFGAEEGWIAVKRDKVWQFNDGESFYGTCIFVPHYISELLVVARVKYLNVLPDSPKMRQLVNG